MLLRERPEVASAEDVPQGAAEPAQRPNLGQWWLVLSTAFFVFSTLVSYALVYRTQYEILLAAAAGIGVALAMVGVKRLPVPAISSLALWVGSALMAITIFYYAHAAQDRLGRALGMFAAIAIPTVAAHFLLKWRAGVPWREAVSEVTLVFTMPKTGMEAALLGTALGFPVIGTYVNLIADPDSGSLVNATVHLRENGFSILTDTQSVFLPFITYGPLLALDGYRAAVLFSIGTVIALCGLTSYLGYKLTDTGAGAVSATLAFLTLAGVPQANRLPLYCLMFFFGYGSGWILHRAMSGAERSRLLSVAAGVGFVLTYEAHGIGQLFLLVPFLLLIVHPWRRARLPLAITLGTIVIASIPRVLVNLAEGGTTAFRSNYTGYMTQKYLKIVNRDLWGYDVDAAPTDYLKNLPSMIMEAVGGYGLLVLLLIPALFAATRSDIRAKLFVVASALIFLAALAVVTPSTFARYLSPLAVGLALVVGIGVATMFKESKTTTFGWLFAGGLLVMAIVRTTTMVNSVTGIAARIQAGPIPQINAVIEDDDLGVVGVRSPQLAWTNPDLRTENHRTMSERDWVTYLTWPNDEVVAEVFERYDVGWVVLMPNMTQEVEYHQTWMTPTYGLEVNHIGGAMESDILCLATESQGYLLYRYGSCEPGDLEDVPEDYSGGIFEPYRVRYIDRGDLASDIVATVGE